MKYYIIKVVAKATEENPNFAGKEHIYYYGKGQKLIAAYGTGTIDQPLTEWFIEEYGYTRLCDAKRSWILNNPTHNKHWNEECTIEEVC